MIGLHDPKIMVESVNMEGRRMNIGVNLVRSGCCSFICKSSYTTRRRGTRTVNVDRPHRSIMSIVRAQPLSVMCEPHINDVIF